MKKLIDLIKETDGYNKLVKQNKEITHNWATHMEWKSSTHKEKYGDIIGEVNHHTLLEDGSITHYDVQFGDKTIKNIPSDKLLAVKEQSHKHEVDKGEDEEEDE